MRRIITLVLSALVIFSFGTVLVPRAASAATPELCTKSPSGIEILPKWYKYLEVSSNGAICDVTAEFPGAIPAILLAVAEILLRIAGILAVVFVVYGGFQYLMSTGEPDKAKAARTTIINALVGLMIAILSTAIVNLVGNNIV